MSVFKDWWYYGIFDCLDGSIAENAIKKVKDIIWYTFWFYVIYES